MKFARSAAKHWFKNARANDLLDPKIYESVRVVLSRNFKTSLMMMLNGIIAKRPLVAVITSWA